MSWQFFKKLRSFTWTPFNKKYPSIRRSRRSIRNCNMRGTIKNGRPLLMSMILCLRSSNPWTLSTRPIMIMNILRGWKISLPKPGLRDRSLSLSPFWDRIAIEMLGTLPRISCIEMGITPQKNLSKSFRMRLYVAFGLFYHLIFLIWKRFNSLGNFGIQWVVVLCFWAEEPF